MKRPFYAFFFFSDLKYAVRETPVNKCPRDKLINICEYIFDNKASKAVSL